VADSRRWATRNRTADRLAVGDVDDTAKQFSRTDMRRD
jgi:hypothetical protein